MHGGWWITNKSLLGQSVILSDTTLLAGTTGIAVSFMQTVMSKGEGLRR